MEKTIVTTGKTIDLAIENALNQLGLDRDSVSVQVLAQAKAGFLGFGAAPAKVQVTYEVPDPVPEKPAAPKSALGSASRSKPKAKPQPKVETKPEAPKPAPQPKVEAPKKEAPKAEKPKAPKAPKAEAPKAEPKVYAPAEPGSVEEKIEQFLKGLLEHMGSKAVPHAVKGEDNAAIRWTLSSIWPTTPSTGVSKATSASMWMPRLTARSVRNPCAAMPARRHSRY